MQAILCDVSLEPITGTAWELQLIHGRAPINSGVNSITIVDRDGGTVLILSEDVGRWLVANIDQLRQSYQLLRDENRGSASLLAEPVAPASNAARTPRAS